MAIDVFLVSIDYVEAYQVGYVEDYIDEPYEEDEEEIARKWRYQIIEN